MRRNGAGKSTLLKALASDLTPASGEVRLGGALLASYGTRELALQRAVLPQQTVLQFGFTAREVVAMGRAPHQGHRREHRPDGDIVAAAMERTDTARLAQRRFPTLSGGEQGRVSLARVVAQEAPVLLLDEPTASLDVCHQQLVLEIARELARAGAAVLAVLHDLNLAAAYADRLAILCQGRLAAFDGPWARLTEGLLSRVFECPFAVARHPVRGCSLVMPLPSAVRRPTTDSSQGPRWHGDGGPRPLDASRVSMASCLLAPKLDDLVTTARRSSMSDDHSPGDRRQPYSDRGGPAGRHAETHDVRREELTNPTGPDPVDESFAEQLAPDTSTTTPGGHVDESTAAVADKVLHERLQMLTGDELARLAVLELGARLDQGGTYLDLNDLGRGPFKAIGGQEASTDNRYVAKRDTDHELWNRLAGRDSEPETVRPATEAESPG